MMAAPPTDWTVDYFLANESDCLKILENVDVLKAIPSLNSGSLDNFKDGQFVHFQGMVQDMYDPEFFLKKYKLIDKNTGEKSIRCGMYVDGICEPYEEELLDSEKDQTAERQSWVVISTPGLNDWVKQDSASVPRQNKISCPPSTSHQNNKRSLDVTEEPMDCSETITKREKVSADESNASSQSNETSKPSIISKDHILNFPIPCEDGKAFIVKVYEEPDFPVQVNQVIDIVGFISLNPNLSFIHDSEMIDDHEQQIHHPPPSLVPRLHAVKIIEEVEKNKPDQSLLTRAAQIRGDLRTLFSQLLFGDEIAADYLICHLISAVYLRRDCLCLGAFSLNVTNFPKEHENFIKDFYEILQLIIAKSHFFEVTIDNLNNTDCVPKKDYEGNRLTSGILQLSKNTHLVLDETKLDCGTLTTFGQMNYAAFNNLIQFQKVAYDFKYYKMEFETDLPILIFSNAKSFIPCQMQIHLKPDPDTVRLYPQVVEAAKQFIKEGNRLSDIRQYINTLRNAEFEFSPDIAEVIKEDFVKLRQDNKNFSADGLHSLMVLSRLTSLSYGLKSLNVKVWKEVLDNESKRLSRLPPNRK